MQSILKFMLLAFLGSFAIAGDVHNDQKPLRPVLVSYHEDTPQSVVDEAIAAIRKAGGEITHEYNLIKGFAAKASEEMLSAIKALQTGDHAPTVEDDQIVSVNSK